MIKDKRAYRKSAIIPRYYSDEDMSKQLIFSDEL